MESYANILFVDIETVSVQPQFSMLSDEMQAEWERKARLIKHTGDTLPDPANVFTDRAGIYSEFAKIVCIAFGTIYTSDGVRRLRLKAISGDDEKTLLEEFNKVVTKMAALHGDVRFCGHNIKEFDIPFNCRRFIINGLTLPPCLMLSGRKPWEITHIDTMELWKFGDVKNYTALSLLAAVLGIPSPKGDIDGSMVSTVYWNEHDLDRISRYCMGDVLTCVRVFLRLKGDTGAPPEPEYADGPGNALP